MGVYAVQCQCRRRSLEVPWPMRVVGVLCPDCDTQSASMLDTYTEDPDAGLIPLVVRHPDEPVSGACGRGDHLECPEAWHMEHRVPCGCLCHPPVAS